MDNQFLDEMRGCLLARHEELRRIDLALSQVDEGEYGYCEVCGEEIARERLRINPSVAVCIRCAAKADGERD